MSERRAPPPAVFVQAGGTLPADYPGYIERAADGQLIESLRAGEYCHVLTTRQMGKSSLMVRAAARLRDDSGVHVAIVDLSFGKDSTREQWYFGVVHRLSAQLSLPDLQTAWDATERLGLADRFVELLRHALGAMKGSLYLFFDEIDGTLDLPYTDDFFASLRACYNLRATEPEFRRLTMAFFGTASPSDLIKNEKRTPFNVGRLLELDDFTLDEARALLGGFSQDAAVTEAALERLVYWTHGHPYLSQRICSEAAARGTTLDAALVDKLVHSCFLDDEQRSDPNLKFVNHRLLGSAARERVLGLYQGIVAGQQVLDEALSTAHNELKLSGVVVTRGGQLFLRNRIYERMFGSDWLRAVLPSRWPSVIVGGPLPRDYPGYVERPADTALFEALREGHYCVVQACRYMGTSSLLGRVASRLEAAGVDAKLLDASGLLAGSGVGYPGTPVLGSRGTGSVTVITGHIGTNTKARRGRVAELIHATRTYLESSPERVVLLVDDFDLPANAAHARELWQVVSECASLRASEPIFNKLTMALHVSAELTDAEAKHLPSDARIIPIEDYSADQVGKLLLGFHQEEGATRAAAERLYEWTGGHPYVTERVCKEAVRQAAALDAGKIDALVRDCFLRDNEHLNAPPLGYIRNHLRSCRQSDSALRIYRQVWTGAAVDYDRESNAQRPLLECGLLVERGGKLAVRNRLFKEVFHEKWLADMAAPTRNRRWVGAAAAVALLLAAATASYFRLVTLPARQYVAALQATEDPVRAEEAHQALMAVPGQRDSANNLFATFWDDRAEAAEAKLDPETALLDRIKALEFGDNELRRRQVGRLREALAPISRTVRLPGRILSLTRKGRFALVSEGSGFRVYEVETQRALGPVFNPLGDEERDRTRGAVSADGRRVVTWLTSSLDMRRDKGAAWLWDAREGTKLKTVALTEPVEGAEFADSHHDRILIRTRSQSEAWEGDSLMSFAKSIPLFKVAPPALPVVSASRAGEVSDDGRRLARLDEVRALQVEDPVSGAPLRPEIPLGWVRQDSTANKPVPIRWADAETVIVAFDGRVRYFAVPLVERPPHCWDGESRAWLSAAVSPDGQTLGVLDEPGQLSPDEHYNVISSWGALQRREAASGRILATRFVQPTRLWVRALEDDARRVRVVSNWSDTVYCMVDVSFEGPGGAVVDGEPKQLLSEWSRRLGLPMPATLPVTPSVRN